ncbi:MAG: alpha/beta hydrolase [Bacteroidota bacterium]
MKNQYQIGIYIFILLLASACGRQEIGPANTTLEPSVSPIDLEEIDATFIENIAYDEYDLTRFDIFLPKSEDPTGLMIYIHGGGFTGGDKTKLYASGGKELPDLTRELLRANIAVATLNYRLLESGETEGVLKSLNDSRRGLQYIRSMANEFNIDPHSIVLMGGSAGAGTSLWLATKDDMIDPGNVDPVLQQSTRVKGVVLTATQSSYDIETRWMQDVFVDYGTTWEDFYAENEGTVLKFYGVSSEAEYNSAEIDEYRRQIDMLAELSADDPEIWVDNTGQNVEAPTTTGIAYHHAFHAREIKEYADAAGVPNVAYYGKNPVIYSDPSGEEIGAFIIRKINEL